MPEIVYRSTHPDVAKAIADYQEAFTAWRAEADKLAAEFGFPGRPFAVAFGLGSRWVVGFEHTKSDPIPTGWRKAERDGMQVIVPDRRRKSGKEISARMEACKPPADLRSSLPGMPAHSWTDTGIYTPALREMDGAVWVIWKAAVPDVDTALWERVKLSTYYAALEAEEAKTS